MLRPAAWFVATLFVLQRNANAQAPRAEAAITGRVVGATNAPVAGATVEVLSVATMQTDSAGAFRFSPVPSGTLMVRARMLGFQPVIKVVVTEPSKELDLTIRLTATTQMLSPVTVREDSSSSLLADPTGFDERRRKSIGGVFILAEEIERKRVMNTEEIFHGIPAITMDTGGIVVIKRGELSIRDFYLAGKDVNQFMTCIGAIVFVDGVEMPQPFNINDVEPARIRAIEIYRGPATTPSKLRSYKTVCGTVAIWTK